MNYYWGFANDFSDEFDDSDVLEHHGIDNQKWGVRHGPPYPLAPSASRMIRSGRKISKKEARHKKTLERIDKSIEKANKAKASGDVSKMERANEHTRRLVAKSERQKVSLERAKAKDEKIRSKYDAEKAKYDEAKAKYDEEKAKADAAEDERILRVGSAEEVLARRERYTPNQLQDAINRIQKETTLKDLKLQSMKTKLDDARGFADSIVSTAGTVFNAYGKYKNIAEMINDIAGDDRLPIPGKGKKYQEKADKEAIQKAIKSGDKDLVAKYRDKMTNKEFNDARDRIETERKFKERYFGDKDSSDKKEKTKVNVVDTTKGKETSNYGKDFVYDWSKRKKGNNKVDTSELAKQVANEGEKFIYNWLERKNK